MKRGKILIVDDNEDILFTLKMLLRPLVESITYQFLADYPF